MRLKVFQKKQQTFLGPADVAFGTDKQNRLHRVHVGLTLSIRNQESHSVTDFGGSGILRRYSVYGRGHVDIASHVRS